MYVNCTSTDRDVVQRLADIVGYGLIGENKLKPGHKQAYTWRIGNRREVLALITAIRPMMGERRGSRIDEMIASHNASPPKRQEKGRMQCGTRSMYATGCNCQPCRDAENRYSRDYHRRKRDQKTALATATAIEASPGGLGLVDMVRT